MILSTIWNFFIFETNTECNNIVLVRFGFFSQCFYSYALWWRALVPANVLNIHLYFTAPNQYSDI